MKLFTGNQEIFVNLLLALTQASFILILCISPCKQDYIRDENLTQNLIGVNFNKTKPETLRTRLCLISKDKDLTVKLGVSTPQELKKKIDCFKADGFCPHCGTVFEAMGCFYHHCSCQEARPSLTGGNIERGNKKREMDQLRKQYIKEKAYNVVENWECESWILYKATTCVEKLLRESFSYKRSMKEQRPLEQIRRGKLFGYVQCDIEVPEELKKNFATFPPVFQNTNVGRHDFRLLMKDYAEKEELLCQPRKMLISSFFLENRTLITPLLVFYFDLGPVCKKFYHFAEYFPVKRFNKVVQSAVNARREGDENPNSSVVAETMNLLANSFYGYQIMDRSRPTVTKFSSDEKTHGAINTKLFQRLDHINDHLYEVELTKAEIELRESIIVGFFILQYAKLRMFELY